jgi:hypothetical protein
MRNRIIQLASVATIAVAALSMPREASARAEACSGQSICWLGCPGNITLFCEAHFGCAPANPPYAVCEPGACGWGTEFSDLVICGGAA